MRFIRSLVLAALGAAALAVPASAAPKPLRMTLVDVEGGAATLFVTPEGKSLLIDTGWPAKRKGAVEGAPTSADRIAAAAAALGVRRIDYLIVTHYHMDHVGGVRDLMAKLPVDVFIDHGENREPGFTQNLYTDYLAVTQGHKRISVKAGDRLKIGSLNLTVVSSDAQPIARPLPGGGAANPACEGVPEMAADGGEENARSVASLITFGPTRIAAYGDLSWNMEKRIACPVDLVGPVDVLIVTQHGSDISSNPADVAALHPVVAVMGNGATKGGDPNAIAAVSRVPGLRGFWRLHASARHPEISGPEAYIANPQAAPDAGYPIQLSISARGRIEVTNPRTGASEVYLARAAVPSAGRP